MRASITRLATRIRDLEGRVDRDDTLELAKQAKQKLEKLDVDFKTHHYNLIDVIDDEDSLLREQGIIDEHDDEQAVLAIRVQQLITTCDSSSQVGTPKIAVRRLQRLKRILSSISEATEDMTVDSDGICLLHQHKEQISDHKQELGDIRNSLLPFNLGEDDDLSTLQTEVERAMFDCSLRIKKLLQSNTSNPTTSDGKGVKLPKLEVPTFDGNILNWRTFWEQFSVSVHDRSNMSDAEKLVYLQHALKAGSAKHAIEGLSRSGDCYDEAVECLRARYNRPRLIHQAHVRMILETPSLKDGSGRELRRLHDVVLQHLRALKAMEYEPSGPFITSALELKLDTNTMFEWQKHSQDSTEVPHFQKLLEFINLRAQASEVSMPEPVRKGKAECPPRKPFTHGAGKPIASFASATSTDIACNVCKSGKHPLYACIKFRSFTLEKRVSVAKANNVCLNCLTAGHVLKDCRSSYRCKRCQKSHHTLLHTETKEGNKPTVNSASQISVIEPSAMPVSTHAAMSIKSDVLLMTCHVLVESPNGSSMKARALLDSASSASFVSERLAQSLSLPRSCQNARISGVAGLTRNSPVQSIANLSVSAIYPTSEKISVTAIVVPHVTCDLPLRPVPFDLKWDHLSDITLADPDFGIPGKVDLLLGVEVFADVMLQGRRLGQSGSPMAFETKFGWVLAGNADACTSATHVATHHASLLTGDDILRKFWELEERPISDSALSPEERSVVQQFKANHTRTEAGRFVVPLPKKPDAKPLGESRSQAVRRFLSLERALHAKGQFTEVEAVIGEYFEMEHAEQVPKLDMEKPHEEVFYLPMHIVRKESSTTTKIRAVFDASAKSSTGVSLNDTLLVGPTVHSSLIDVLLRFRRHRIALTTDVSRMYRGVELFPPDRDLHRFVWRSSDTEPLRDYRMTRVTFGVSASSFAANMSVKQNAHDFAMTYPLAFEAVSQGFYVDDGLTGADTVEGAINLHKQLQDLFDQAKLLLRKWNSNEPQVLQHISPEIRDSRSVHLIPDPEEYTKTLGVEWNTGFDHFRLTVAEFPPLDKVTKRVLVSDIAKTYDVLGWFSPTIIKVKILLQRLWEQKIDWDDPIPQSIHDAWSQWRAELSLLSSHRLPRCYFPKDVQILSVQLHGFSDASEQAYAGVIYIRGIDSKGKVHVSLVMSKTKVAPIKRLTIPRLELCGAHLLAQLLHHVKEVFNISHQDVYAWTDSTIVLNWLVGNPRRFKTYVGNRISHMVELIAPDRWNHVEGVKNPADCASRGLFPSELIDHDLWWNGPDWLYLSPWEWPIDYSTRAPNSLEEEGSEICHHTTVVIRQPIVPLDRYSSFTRLKRVTAWVLRFIHNCRSSEKSINASLTVKELSEAETYWLSVAQESCFTGDIDTLKNDREIRSSSRLLPLHPFLDSSGVLRVGGREERSKRQYHSQHPVILDGKHSLTKLVIRSEHVRLLHAGPTLLTAALCRKFHIIGCRKVVRSTTRSCVTCRRKSSKPRPPMMGQLPMERVTPDAVFNRVGVDYAGPFYIKYGPVRKPTVIKAYVCVFVSLSVKAVHLELVSDLTTEAFIAALRRFISRRGKPTLLWSDHGSNFIGAAKELQELVKFLHLQKTQGVISDFCTTQNIAWEFIPERAPHFGGLWEAAVKSMKSHLKRVTTNVKLTFEELTTILTQIEACLNSRPLVSLPGDDDGIEALTPGHFLIGRPIEALPDPSFSFRSLTLLRRWHLCQALVRHFWQRWSTEYLSSLQRFAKWHRKSKNLTVGDVVILREDGMVPAKWPIARITKTHAGRDGIVRVVTIKTSTGTYTRPVTKIAPLLPLEP